MFSDNRHVDFHKIYTYEISTRSCTDFESRFHLLEEKGKKRKKKRVNLTIDDVYFGSILR